MCESNNCLSCLAYTFMVLGLSACLIAFAAPFWLVYDYANIIPHTGNNLFDKAAGSITSEIANIFGGYMPWSEGLFGFCYNSQGLKCKWVWEDDLRLEKNLEDWQKASQGLYMGGVILILFAGLISTLHTCCCCCKRSFSIRTALGSLVFAAVLCIGASLTVYGVFAERSGKLKSPASFFWGFYLGVAGVASCLLASVLYFIDGCMTKNYDGYHMTRVV